MRRALLDKECAEEQVVSGAVRIYLITPVSTVWDSAAAATALQDVMQARRGEGAAVPTRDMHDLMEVLALGVLATRFTDDQNRTQWWGILKCMERDIAGTMALVGDGGPDPNAELHELLVHIVTKFYLELTTPELSPDATLETVQGNAVEWFQMRQQG